MFFPELDDIYFEKSKEYMKEVIESYAVGNYRSATVLLYSVAICDIMLKLQELIDMYNDSGAKEILSDIEKIRNDSTLSKSKWEKELLKKVYERTELLSDISYTNLNHLIDHRNYCAHPALNAEFELYSPNKETVVAHIRNVLNDILVKPPIFIKNIVDFMTNDLENKREIYINDKENLKVYLHNKYYTKMTISMAYKVFKAFWKMCFFVEDDDHCNSNREINRYAISILFEYKKSELLEYIKRENDKLLLSEDSSCLKSFIIFLADYSEVYNILSEDKKHQIEKYIEKNNDIKWITWFMQEDLNAHLECLDKADVELEEEWCNCLYVHYKDYGLKSSALDFFISIFGKSYSYYDADDKYDALIEPYLAEFTKEQFVNLIKVINDNDQIHNRRASWRCNNTIIRYAKDLLRDFNYTSYPYFSFDNSIMDKGTY